MIQVFSIGDSIAVLCDGDRIKATFPLAKASEFTRSPQLLCTNPVQNVFLDKLDINYDLVADWSFRDLEQPALTIPDEFAADFIIPPDANAIIQVAGRNFREARGQLPAGSAPLGASLFAGFTLTLFFMAMAGAR